MKKMLHGTFTIEAAVIVPVILGVFALVITLLFYYHDKNIVAGIAHETVVKGCGEQEISSEELEMYFQKRIRKKLLLFSSIHLEAGVEEDKVSILCRAEKKGMALRIEMSMNRTSPEQFIRNIRRVDKLEKQLGETK